MSPRLRPPGVISLAAAKQKLYLSLIILFGLMGVGAAGFYVLGDNRDLFESVYVTVVILTTVGMKETSVKLNSAEQVWALVLMLAGISTALYAAGNLVAFIIEGDMRRLYGRRQLQNKIDKLVDHYIFCGFGRMGKALCASLAQRGAPFVLIEWDTDKTAIADELGYLYIVGDAMSEQTLKLAHVDKAKGLSTCLPSDADNVFVTLTARGLCEQITISARSELKETESKLLWAGATRVICMPDLGASKVTRMLLTPTVDELIELAVAGPDIEVSKLSIKELHGASGKTLRELDLRSKMGITVVAVHEDGRREFSPASDLNLSDGDELIVIGPSGGIERVMEFFNDDS